MPLSERLESAWFTVLAALQLCLSGTILGTAVYAMSDSTFTFATLTSSMIGAIFSLVCHSALIYYAVRMPQRLDYDVLLTTGAGLLLMFFQAAALAASDGNVFLAFVGRALDQIETEHPLPPGCTAGGLCGWDAFNTVAQEVVERAPDTSRLVVYSALLAVVIEMTILAVGSYQRCGLTASDDRYVK